MDEKTKTKALEKLTTAKRSCNWVITRIEGDEKPDTLTISHLKLSKKSIRKAKERIEAPPSKEIIDNPKPDWMPLMICDIVQLPFNVGDEYSWEELEDLVIELCLAGGDGIRIFAKGWKPKIEPLKKTLLTRKYSFFKPNPKWDEALERFADLLHKYHMRLYVDLYDNCSVDEPWNPFNNSIHNFRHGFYGYTKSIKTNRKDKDGNWIYLNEVDFMIEYWDNRILACLDPEKDIVGLGNELKSHVENNVEERKIWAEEWGVKRAKNILDKGFKPPIPFSGSEETAHKLFGYISAEEHKDDYGWTYQTSCNQIHGKGLVEHVKEWAKDGISQQRVFSITDDGVGTNKDSMIPEDLRGYCEIRPDGSKYACTANTAERIKCVRAFIEELKDRSYCHSIAFLPREILYKDKTCLDRFDPKVSADIYWKLAEDLWGIDIRRKQA